MLMLGALLTVVTGSVLNVVAMSKYNRDANQLVTFLKQSVQNGVLKNQKVKVDIDLSIGTFESRVEYEDLDEVFKNKSSGESNSSDNSEYDDSDAVYGEEDVIKNEPLRLMYIDNIQLEDGSKQMDGTITLQANGGGWNESFIIELLNEEETVSLWIKCDRGTASVRKYNTPAELPEPRAEIN